jgi:hypothetical protein
MGGLDAPIDHVPGLDGQIIDWLFPQTILAAGLPIAGGSTWTMYSILLRLWRSARGPARQST